MNLYVFFIFQSVANNACFLLFLLELSHAYINLFGSKKVKRPLIIQYPACFWRPSFVLFKCVPILLLNTRVLEFGLFLKALYFLYVLLLQTVSKSSTVKAQRHDNSKTVSSFIMFIVIPIVNLVYRIFAASEKKPENAQQTRHIEPMLG